MSRLVYRQKDWDLAELLPEPDEDVIEQRLAEIDGLVERLEAGRGKLENGIETSRHSSRTVSKSAQ